ncbi:MAG: hypothetical protein OHK0028_18160 [Deltaproteobacteria bacterium]
MGSDRGDSPPKAVVATGPVTPTFPGGSCVPGEKSTMVTVFVTVSVPPSEVYRAFTVAVWSGCRSPSGGQPAAPIEACKCLETLQFGVTDVVVRSLHVAAAVYIPPLFSFSEEGPAIDRADTIGGPEGGGTGVTYHEYAGAWVDLSPVLSTGSPRE